MGTAVLMLPPLLEFEDCRVLVHCFLRDYAPARSVEIRLSDDDIRFWPIIPYDLIHTATDIAGLIIYNGQSQSATLILRGFRTHQGSVRRRERLRRSQEPSSKACP